LLQNFKIGGDRFARPAMRALGLVEKALALVVTAADGSVRVRTVKPSGYPIPVNGPVGA
jgi:hypothetical protein